MNTNCHHFDLQQVKDSSLMKAVAIVTSQVLNKEMTTVTFISSDDSFKFRDFKTEFFKRLQNLTLNKIYTFLRLESTSPKILTRSRKRFPIILMERFDQFLEVYRRMDRNHFWLNGFYIIILLNGEIQEIDEIFSLLWKIQVFNVVIIFQHENETVEVKTFKPFNPGNCNNTSSVTINTFRDQKFITNGRFFPNKLLNLFNCTIRISISPDVEPFIFVDFTDKDKASYSLKGSDIKIINTLSKSSNFNINYTYIGMNGTLEALTDDKADLSISNWWLLPDRLKTFDTTTFYSNDQIVFVIPLGKEFSAFQELVHSFSMSVWLLIFSCFFIGFFVIFVVRFQVKAVQNFVFGTGVKNPTLNMFAAFIGGTQKILPRRNFARFLLMLFLMYSLVIRALFQGSFFKLLKENKREQEVKTINEMIQKDFTFYVAPLTMDAFLGMENIRKRSVDQFPPYNLYFTFNVN